MIWISPWRKCSVRTLTDLARQLSTLWSLLEQGSKNSKPLYLPIACTLINNEHEHNNRPISRVVIVVDSISVDVTEQLDRISPRGMTDEQGWAKPYSTLTLPPLCLPLFEDRIESSYGGSRLSLPKDFLRHCYYYFPKASYYIISSFDNRARVFCKQRRDQGFRLQFLRKFF